MEETASAIGKLTRQSVPIILERFKYEIEALKEELGRLENANKAPKTNKQKVKSIFTTDKGRRLVERRMEEVREKISRLSDVKIEALLTPLSVDEYFEVQHAYLLRRLSISRSKPDNLTEQGEKDFEDTLNIICNQALQAKYVECVVKKKENGKLVRFFTPQEVISLNASLQLEILSTHLKEFQLSDDELKKSLAPTMIAN